MSRKIYGLNLYLNIVFFAFYYYYIYIYILSWSEEAKAAGIIHNEIYSVNFVCIDFSSEKITVLGFLQVFYESISLHFFYTMHSFSVLGKEAKSWFYIGYFICTHVLVLLLRVVNCSETACVMWRIKINLVRY